MREPRHEGETARFVETPEEIALLDERPMIGLGRPSPLLRVRTKAEPTYIRRPVAPESLSSRHARVVDRGLGVAVPTQSKRLAGPTVSPSYLLLLRLFIN
jgi:hypothetical protein